jgi:hypothetical protein
MSPKPKKQSDHTNPKQSAQPQSTAVLQQRSHRLKPPSPYRAQVAQTSESKDTADIRRQLSITTISHTSRKDNIGQPHSDIRDSPLSPSCRSTNHTHAQSLPRDMLTVQVPTQREEALKKPSAIRSASGNLPSPPKQHEEFPR